MRTLLLPLSARFIVFTSCVAITALLLAEYIHRPSSDVVAVLLAVFGALAAIGVYDLLQTRHAVLRNYPLTAHIRFILEEIRPEIRQYFLESEKDGTPFSRDKRAIVYQRAKHALDKRPFGTQNDVYASGFEWLHHSIATKPVATAEFRVAVGGPDCTRPYSASVFNISAMSFGALSAERHPRAQHRRQEGQFRPRYRGRRLQLASPRSRRRHHLGDRLGLFRLPQRGRHVLRGEIRGEGQERPGQDGRAQAQSRARSPATAAFCPPPR